MVVDLTTSGGCQSTVNSQKPGIGVLLLHGLNGSPAEMRPVARHLQRAGYQVSAPLLPGHGGTHQQLLDTGWKDWLAGAKQALEELAAQCDAVVVCGLSMGSSLAVMLAAGDPRVRGVVLLSTALRYDAPGHSRLHVLFPLIDVFPFLGRWFYWTEQSPYGLKDKRLQRMIEKAVAAGDRGNGDDLRSIRTYSGSLRQMSHLVNHAKRNAPGVTCPALIIHSIEDTLTTTANAADIYERLGSKDRSLILLDGCDHVLTLDLRKNDVARYIGDFIKRVCGTPVDVDEPPLVAAQQCTAQL